MIDVFKGLGVEITLPSGSLSGEPNEKQKADFLKIKETLTRIGIASKKEKKLYQSCHILHKQGRYAIMHFKEMFLLDGRESDLTEEDVTRRNIIATRLAEWNLVKINEQKQVDNGDKTAYIKIIPYSEKSDWDLVAKYNVGKFKGKTYSDERR